MVAEVKENIGTIRGVNVRSLEVVIAGHTVEQLLVYDFSEAEVEYGRPFDNEMDEYIQMGMFAINRIAADGLCTRLHRPTATCSTGSAYARQRSRIAPTLSRTVWAGLSPERTEPRWSENPGAALPVNLPGPIAAY